MNLNRWNIDAVALAYALIVGCAVYAVIYYALNGQAPRFWW